MRRHAALLLAALALLGALAALTQARVDPAGLEARVDARLREAPAGSLAVAIALDRVGGTLVGLGLAALAAAALALAGRRASAAALVAGTLLTLLASGLLKVALGRERPDDALLQLAEGAFPSGHAARAAFFACFSVGLAARMRPRWVPAVAAFALLYALTMGASRVVLHVHRAYDVLGGWALGVAVWSLTALVLARASEAPP